MTSPEIEKLAQKILHHKKLYYNGEPEISDEVYDAMENELRSKQPDHPVLHLVGTPSGGKVQHDPPMLSSQKATSLEEVVKWAKEIEMRPITAGYKVDGLSLSIVYEDGRLKQGATRGNGYAGDDVTLECIKIEGIPQTLPVDGHVNVRGEVFMPISEFHRVNSTLPKEDQYSSPRNLATGTLKQKTLEVLDERILQFMAWQLIGYAGDRTNDQLMDLLKSWGFSVADRVLLPSPNQDIIEETFQKFVEERNRIDFEIDGVIFKYNLPDDRNNAGITEHHPKWSIAWKFQSKGEITTVESITWQVGRTGVITPVAEVEPVDVAGATIKRATLHNVEIMETLNVAPGDRVALIRAGDVIPKILDVVDKGPSTFSYPKKCPSCNSPTKRVGVDLICTGDTCRDRDIQQISYWIKQTEIKGLGEKSIEKLYDEGIISHYADLYSDTITAQKLESLLGKNGLKIYEEIEKTRQLPFATFLAGLGIQNLGPKMGKILAERYKSYEELKATTIDELTELDGISDLTASYILKGVNNPNTGDRVLQHGIEFVSPDVRRRKLSKPKNTGLGAWFSDNSSERETEEEIWDNLIDSTYADKKIYVTGSVEGLTKKDLQQELESRGIIWHKSVSSNLDFLIFGEGAGQRKLDDADKKGVTKMPWKEFNESLERPIQPTA